MAAGIIVAGQPRFLPNIVGYGDPGGGGNTLLTDLLACWKFDESGGTTAADSTGRGNTLTLAGTPTPTFVPGLINNCIDFAGASATEVAARANPTGGDLDLVGKSFTFVFWFKINTFVVGRQILGRDTGGAGGRQYSVQLAGTNTLNIRVFDGTNAVGTVNLTYTNGAWQMLTWGVDLTAGGAFGQMFASVNNGARSTNNLTAAIGAVTTDFRVGRGGGASSIDCNVDAAAFWGRALSVAEETRLYNGGAGRYPI